MVTSEVRCWGPCSRHTGVFVWTSGPCSSPGRPDSLERGPGLCISESGWVTLVFANICECLLWNSSSQLPRDFLKMIFKNNAHTLWYYVWNRLRRTYCIAWASQVALGVKKLPAKAGDIRDVGSFPGLGRSPGGGHGNRLQYSYLENLMDRGGLWATVHRVAKSQTWLTLSLSYIYIIMLKSEGTS